MAHVEAPEAGGRVIPTLLTFVELFAAIGVVVAAIHSASQALKRRGASRYAHALSVGLVFAIMAALMVRQAALARMLSVPLLGAGAWTLAIERRWYRVFPLMLMLFALLLILGYVAGT